MRLGMRARVTVFVGLMVAACFLVLGIRELTRTPPSPAQAASPSRQGAATAPSPVFLSAVRPIKTGETITADMVRNRPGDPQRYPYAATAAEVIGKVATRDIAANMLVARDAVGAETKLAIRVPIGMRAVSIDTTAEIAVAGLVRPGDRVDVQVIYPGADAISGARGMGRSRAETLLQMVQVLAVGELVVGANQKTGPDGQQSTPQPPARTVTLALTPEQVSTLSLAKSTGGLYLSLRNPIDDQQVAVAAMTSRPSLAAPAERDATAPPPRAAAQPKRAARQPSHAIELLVGDRREVIYSGSTAR
nr:Flp pilus assembly protein CpaB [Sphingobium fuliginis]